MDQGEPLRSPRLPVAQYDFLSRYAASQHVHRVDSPTRIDSERLLAEAGFVRRLAQALVRRQDVAEDVAQDVLMAALQQPGPVQQPRAWLATITRRLAAKARHAAQQRAVHEAAAAPPVADDAASRTAERLQLQRRLCDAVFGLPEPYRTTVTLRFFDGLPPRTIAQRMATTSDVVRQRLHRGLAMLRQRLDGECGGRGAWVRTFAALGLVPAGSPWLLLTVLAMNKFAIAAAALLAASLFLLWPESPPPSVTASLVATAGPAERALAANPASTATDTASGTIERALAPATAGPACVVTVVDARSAPVVAADVHGWSNRGDALVRRTDDAGCCTFGDLAGPGEFLVAAAGRAPHRARCDQRQGEQRLVLPDGASIRGVLVVDGKPPTRPWLLALGPFEPGRDEPETIAQRYRWNSWGNLERGCALRIASDGTFAFTGLPADWRGSIRLPQPLRLLPGTNPMRNEIDVAAGDDVRLLTTQLPTLDLQLLWADDHTPVADAGLDVVASFEHDPNDAGLSCRGDAEGRASLGLASLQPADDAMWSDPARRPAVTRVWLRVTAPGGEERIERTFPREELRLDQVHVLHLPRARRTHFMAVDGDGEPIVGAYVEAHGLSEPTGSDGRGTFRGLAKDVRRVGARGFRIGPTPPRAPAAGTREDPLVFALAAGNSVRLRFVDVNGTSTRCSDARLTTNSPLLSNGTMSASEIDRALGCEVEGGDARRVVAPDGTETWTDCGMYLDELQDGLALLESLTPGQPCTVSVLDPLRTELVRHTFVTPPFGAHATVEIVVPGTPIDLCGQVVDAAGEPIARGHLVLAVPGADRQHTTASTAFDGTFRFAGIRVPGPLQLRSSAEGFATQHHELPPLALGAAPLVIRLERGNAVTVRVLGAAGEPVDAPPRLADDPLHDACDPLGPGCRRFRDLPPGQVTFTCSIGGTRFELRHDTKYPDAELRVPTPATLSLVPQHGWPTASKLCWLLAEVQRLDTAAAPLRVAVGSEPEQTLLLLPGRYRIELFERRLEGLPKPAGEEPTERPLGLTAEVTLVAGVQVRAVLQ